MLELLNHVSLDLYLVLFVMGIGPGCADKGFGAENKECRNSHCFGRYLFAFQTEQGNQSKYCPTEGVGEVSTRSLNRFQHSLKLPVFQHCAQN